MVMAITGLVAPASLAKGPSVSHYVFEDEPFIFDLSDPSGSFQCDVQGIGTDTGVLNYVAFFDSTGLVVNDLYIQSFNEILTNPDNGKTIEVRYALVERSSYTQTGPMTFSITTEVSGLNMLHKGDTVLTLAGHATITVVVQFDKRGQVTIADVMEDFTPHIAHANSYLCSFLG